MCESVYQLQRYFRSGYGPEGPAQLELCPSTNWMYIDIYSRQSRGNHSSKHTGTWLATVWPPGPPCYSHSTFLCFHHIPLSLAQQIIRRVCKNFICFRPFSKISKMVCWLPHVCLSVRLSFSPSFRTEQIGYHRTDFRDIWYWNIFRNLVERLLVSLKCDKNDRFFT